MYLRNKLNLAMGLLLLINLISCTASPLESPTMESPTVETNQNWVIFTKEQAEEPIIEWSLVKYDDFWMPSEDHIVKLEEELPEYLSRNSAQLHSQPPVWQRLEAYQRQYVGIERGGRKFIYGNYFCNGEGTDWRQTWAFGIDGGDCYFRVEYDLEDEVFIMLEVNGES